MSKKQKIILVALCVLFFVFRLPGVSLPYHQDEAKTVTYSVSAEKAGELFAHPPFMQMLFFGGMKVFGPDYLRLLPILFGALSVVFLYLFINNRYGKSSAIWTSFLFTLCIYNVWGNLQLDVDGSILPFFFLLSVYVYDKFNQAQDTEKRKHLGFLVTVLLFGWLVKLNFILVIGVLVADYLLTNWKTIDLKKAGYGILGVFGFGILYIALLYVIQFLYPAFHIEYMVNHANQFNEKAGRNYIQVLVQGVKAVYYLSPLLILPLLFASKEIFKKSRIFILYLFFGILFYFVVFDFSRGALDKYLMFATLPLAVISGLVFDSLYKKAKEQNVFSSKQFKITCIIGAVVSLVLILINFLPHEVVVLYPKTEWFARVLRGDWVILTPFNGGSGPVGFYISFLFIAISFIISLICGVVGVVKKDWRVYSVLIMLFVGITYNVIFAEELLFGKIYGSSEKVILETTNFIRKNNTIKQVLTFNNTGSYELIEMGKYAGRVYAIPEFEPGNKEKFVTFDGDYLIVEIPRLYGFYGKFFDQCTVLFETNSQMIRGRVYDCKNAIPLINKL